MKLGLVKGERHDGTRGSTRFERQVRAPNGACGVRCAICVRRDPYHGRRACPRRYFHESCQLAAGFALSNWRTVMGRGRYRSGDKNAADRRRISVPTGRLAESVPAFELHRVCGWRGSDSVRRIQAIWGCAPRPRHERKATNCQVKNGLNAPGRSRTLSPFESAGCRPDSRPTPPR